MKAIVVLGAGRIGAVIAELLARTGDYAVTLADRDGEALGRADMGAPIARARLDVADREALEAALRGKFAVLSATPFDRTAATAEAALAAGAHYFDLTEDVAGTQRVRALAESARTAFMPQCGLAPGFVSIVAHDLAGQFDGIDSLRLRVGALPQYPTNALTYNLTWSVEGLINEYCEACEAIVDGRPARVAPLEGLEEFSLDGTTYEAFNTSGGLGSLCETYAGRVRELNYRSIRYPGHRALMKALLHDLRLAERRDVLKEILERAIPATFQDVVVVFATATGRKDGRLLQKSDARKVYGDVVDGRPRGAIQITTAAGICAALDLLAEGKLPARGFLRQEDIKLSDFLSNRFGRAYARPAARDGLDRAA